MGDRAMLALVYDPRPWRWAACKTLGAIWPAVYTSRLSALRLREVPVPALPGPQWVRLRTRLGGICGTDLGIIFQRSHPASFLASLASFPMVLGHENVAVVEEVGGEVGGWRVGQRVCVEPAISCAARQIAPPCPQCAAGLFSLCDHFAGGALPAAMMIGLNSFTGGSWAPYFVAHHSQLHAVPETIDDETAVLVDPLACSLHAVLRHRPADADRVLVYGAGIIGLGVVMMLRGVGCGATVTALVRRESQAERMRAAGAQRTLCFPRRMSSQERYDGVAAEVGGRRVPGRFGNQMLIGGYDVVFDCVGTGASLTDCMKFCRPRGTVVAVGTSSITVVDTTTLWVKELSVLGVYGRQMESPPEGGPPRHTYELVFDLLRSGRLNTAGLLTHRFELREYRRAFEVLTWGGQRTAIKAAFVHR